MGDRESAEATLRRVNYYRLSGYWYPFRKQAEGGREDDFYEGTRFSDVVSLYEFDARLRAATFAALVPVELAIRALLGHELGRVDPCAHLDPALLGPTARRGDRYSIWLEKYRRELRWSREDFVKHHDKKYGARLPVWAAVEIIDWGSLTHLFRFAPPGVREKSPMHPGSARRSWRAGSRRSMSCGTRVPITAASSTASIRSRRSSRLSVDIPTSMPALLTGAAPSGS